MAVAALVLGLVAIVFCWVPYLAIPCGIIALILGIIQINKSKKSEDKKGKGMSIAGIITGAIGAIISIIITIVLAVIVASAAKGVSEAAKEFNNWAEDYDWSSYSSNYDFDY